MTGDGTRDEAVTGATHATTTAATTTNAAAPGDAPGDATSGAQDFRAFERDGWERVPVEYDDGFGTLTPQAVQPLLDAAQVGPDTNVLDVATGPGYVAAAAAARGARVVAVDFSAAMVEHARARHPDLDIRTGDAEALPFPAACFDAVVMNFGLLHLARPEAALAEAARVLRPGGRCAFTVWAPPAEAIGFGIVLDAVATHGTTDVPLPAGPPFFRFSDAAECRRALQQAGFVDPRVTRVPQTWSLSGGEALYEFMANGTVRTAGLLRAQTPAATAAIRAAISKAAERYRTNADTVELPMPAVLAVAVRA